LPGLPHEEHNAADAPISTQDFRNGLDQRFLKSITGAAPRPCLLRKARGMAVYDVLCGGDQSYVVSDPIYVPIYVHLL
jgi:hypothetical protein